MASPQRSRIRDDAAALDAPAGQIGGGGVDLVQRVPPSYQGIQIQHSPPVPADEDGKVPVGTTQASPRPRVGALGDAQLLEVDMPGLQDGAHQASGTALLEADAARARRVENLLLGPRGPDGVDGVVHPAARQGLDRLDGVVLGGVHTVGRPEAPGKGQLVVAQVHRDDGIRPHDAGRGDGAQAHPAGPEHGHRFVDADVQGVEDHPGPGEHRAAHDGRDVGGHFLVQWHHQSFREERVVGPGRGPHRHGPASPLRVHRRAWRSALDGPAIDPGGDDVVAFPDVGDLTACGRHHPGGLMPQQRGEHGRSAAVRGLGSSVHLVQLGVADAAGEKLDQDLVRLWVGKGYLVDDQRGVRFDDDGGRGARRHAVSSPEVTAFGREHARSYREAFSDDKQPGCPPLAQAESATERSGAPRVAMLSPARPIVAAHGSPGDGGASCRRRRRDRPRGSQSRSMPIDHRSVEPKWQARWKAANLHRTTFDPKKPKFYALDMFPYPSGSGLHVGHCEGYTATDIITRWKRMQGWNVLHPMGWDAFGLPAENYAIKTGVHPRITTEEAIANFRRQIDSIGFAYDWEREVNTTDPAYFKWTQWIFLQLFERGLAYEGTVPINWCPSCKTGLANEEVSQGKCERCGTPVERKDMRQWLLRITRYADRLLEDLAEVDWPESTLTMQRNWIGRSEGAEVAFKVAGSDGQPTDDEIRVFTTRPDTLFGATYMVLAPEHTLVAKVTTEAQAGAVADYQAAARTKSDLERTDLAKQKTGAFTGGYAINPVNDEKIPIWIADYVLASYGTGAIMAVPAHDERDSDFATKYHLPVHHVVIAGAESALEPGPYVDDGININSGLLDGLKTPEAKKRMTEELQRKGQGKLAVSYRLRDWVFSRQRYWGEPIPIVHCPTHGPVAVPEKDLPVRLPEVERYAPSGTGESPLTTIEAWVATTCPTCGGPARRETNTMPQWAGSCWYYLRYLDARNDAQAWGQQAEKDWMAVDLYVGGAEHAVLHLLYSRFWHKVLYDLGYVTTKEPFKKLRHQGTVLAHTYQDAMGRYHELGEVDFRGEDVVLQATGEGLKVSVEKMAKSMLNGVNPDDVVAEHGADVLRLYEMFMGDFELPKPWDPRAIEGCARFLKRLWRLVEEHDDAKAAKDDPHLRLRHKTIKKVTQDLEAMKFNTAISAMMEYLNELASGGATREDLTTLIKLLGPYAPHLGDEAWEKLGGQGFLIEQGWPAFDEALTQDAVIALAIQVNGRLRGNGAVDRTAPETEVRGRAARA